LLQPRDFLTSNLLYVGVGGTLIAVIVGTIFAGGFEVTAPSFTTFWGNPDFPVAAPLFPLLFVTIACGTISGFHSLVSSGTTAKQLDKETDARLIGYGGMLGEGLLATVALITIAVAFSQIPEQTFSGIGLALPMFATGGGQIWNTAFGVGTTLAATFMGLVLVSFLLTSTDTACRLGRYMLEEVVGTPESTIQEYAVNRYVSSALLVIPAYVLVASGSWSDLWPLFGGANQTLAALALLVATVWLANWDDTKQLLSTGGPMAVMIVMTSAALLYLAFVQNLWTKFIQGDWGLPAGETPGILMQLSAAIQIVIALVLVALAWSIFKMGWDNMREVRSTGIMGGTSEPAEPSDD
jgi:carbon starvation protein